MARESGEAVGFSEASGRPSGGVGEKVGERRATRHERVGLLGCRYSDANTNPPHAGVAPLRNWTGARTAAPRRHHKEGRLAGESEAEFWIGTKSSGALQSGRMGRNETLLRRKRRSRLRWHGEPSERRRQLEPQCNAAVWIRARARGADARHALWTLWLLLVLTAMPGCGASVNNLGKNRGGRRVPCPRARKRRAVLLGRFPSWI